MYSLYAENYKKLKKKVKDLNRWKICCVYGLEASVFLRCPWPDCCLFRFNITPIKTPAGSCFILFFCGYRQADSKIHIERQKLE